MKNRYKNITMAALVCAACAVISCFGTFRADAAARPSYLKSVTYFGDEWPINFWSSETPHMEEELQQIVADGFNSIILAIPWREFQPDVYRYEEFNPYAMEKLDRIMEAADRHGLWVTVRLGYTWDYYDSQNVFLRYEDLLDNHQTRQAWDAYASKMYQTLSAYPNFYGGFMTWEDFWGLVEQSFSLNDGYEAVKRANSSGYTPYLRARYGLDEISSLYGYSINRYSDITFPKRESQAAKLVFEWYDDFLNHLLVDTQKVFPGLSMEVRFDQDPVRDENGNIYGYSHEKTYPCGSAEYVSAMISVSMGQENKGERVEASKAVNALSGLLGNVAAKNGGKRMYFEQFLYMDNTEQFSGNAQIKDEELPAFITGMAPAFKRYSMGYGLWVYRDYAENALYNPQFAVGLRGWSTQKGVKLETRDKTPMAKLPAGGLIKQRLHGNVQGGGDSLGQSVVSFRAISEEPVELTVSLGNSNQTVEINGDQTMELSFYGIKGASISFESNGTVYLDDIKAYHHIQKGRSRDIHGQEQDCLPAIRALNRAI